LVTVERSWTAFLTAVDVEADLIGMATLPRSELAI
jgi:hypothetical protein